MLHNPLGEKFNIPQKISKRTKLRKPWSGRLRGTYSETLVCISQTHIEKHKCNCFQKY